MCVASLDWPGESCVSAFVLVKYLYYNQKTISKRCDRLPRVSLPDQSSSRIVSAKSVMRLTLSTPIIVFALIHR